jgi:hypothetical protein
VRCEAGRLFINKKREYLKHRINGLSMNKKHRNQYRGINQFMRGYHSRSNLVRDDYGLQIPATFKIDGRTTFLS